MPRSLKKWWRLEEKSRLFAQKHWHSERRHDGLGRRMQKLENCSSRDSRKEGLEKERPRTIKDQGQVCA